MVGGPAQGVHGAIDHSHLCAHANGDQRRIRSHHPRAQLAPNSLVQEYSIRLYD
jgi:hypothetical protein